MTAVRAARLPASLFVEEADHVGAGDRTDTEMAERGQDGTVEVAEGRLHRGRSPECERRSTYSAANFVSVGPETGKGTGLPPSFSRARKAGAAARFSSAFTRRTCNRPRPSGSRASCMVEDFPGNILPHHERTTGSRRNPAIVSTASLYTGTHSAIRPDPAHDSRNLFRMT